MRKRKARELIAWFSVWRQFRRKRVTLETSFLFLVRLSTAVQKTSPRSGPPEIFEGGGGGVENYQLMSLAVTHKLSAS